MKEILLFVLFLLPACLNHDRVVAKDIYYFKGQEFHYLVLEDESGNRKLCEVSEREYQIRNFNEVYECQSGVRYEGQ